MKNDIRIEELLEQDWGDEWENLSPAPPLVLKDRKSAQLTLRLPADLVSALRDIARRKALPYHALARSWIAEGLQRRQIPTPSDEAASLATQGDHQLNVKVSGDLLDQLKRFSHETRYSYHRLARLWLDAALRRELESVQTMPFTSKVTLKELMILLLDTTNPHTGQAAVRGMTRLQKLLFVIDMRLANSPSRFYAYNYGPFDEQVNDAVDALQTKGLVQGFSRVTTARPSVEEMLKSVNRHAGPRTNEPKVFVLTPEGRAVADQLRRSNAAYGELANQIQQLREEWDRPDLIDRVYEAFPEYTGRSVIKEQVASRIARRQRE